MFIDALDDLTCIACEECGSELEEVCELNKHGDVYEFEEYLKCVNCGKIYNI